ncbi:hypothetical protein DLAC_06007 [Tieghemostelium lacteum]|uniref:Uncharacterized protein n=1 Tax=Tieghemostelium lacteum TaxID=361077 RepID=A0A151ZHE1_TIELA|nr:hypothetical protein DLAC_06007 [Tieghemostelium lacteum]|eukprot:KYQ93337.1 hypothetical protein DLAC_06007 [Tieghemostelium lacteum]
MSLYKSFRVDDLDSNVQSHTHYDKTQNELQEARQEIKYLKENYISVLNQLNLVTSANKNSQSYQSPIKPDTIINNNGYDQQKYTNLKNTYNSLVKDYNNMKQYLNDCKNTIKTSLLVNLIEDENEIEIINSNNSNNSNSSKDLKTMIKDITEIHKDCISKHAYYQMIKDHDLKLKMSNYNNYYGSGGSSSGDSGGSGLINSNNRNLVTEIVDDVNTNTEEMEDNKRNDVDELLTFNMIIKLQKEAEIKDRYVEYLQDVIRILSNEKEETKTQIKLKDQIITNQYNQIEDYQQEIDKLQQSSQSNIIAHEMALNNAFKQIDQRIDGIKNKLSKGDYTSLQRVQELEQQLEDNQSNLEELQLECHYQQSEIQETLDLLDTITRQIQDSLDVNEDEESSTLSEHHNSSKKVKYNLNPRETIKQTLESSVTELIDQNNEMKLFLENMIRFRVDLIDMIWKAFKLPQSGSMKSNVLSFDSDTYQDGINQLEHYFSKRFQSTSPSPITTRY